VIAGRASSSAFDCPARGRRLKAAFGVARYGFAGLDPSATHTDLGAIRRRALPDAPDHWWLAERACQGSGRPMPGIDLPSLGAPRLRAAYPSKEIRVGRTRREPC
jgi:hypothetical protein